MAAVLVTFSTAASLLAAYSARVIRVTDRRVVVWGLVGEGLGFWVWSLGFGIWGLGPLARLEGRRQHGERERAAFGAPARRTHCRTAARALTCHRLPPAPSSSHPPPTPTPEPPLQTTKPRFRDTVMAVSGGYVIAMLAAWGLSLLGVRCAPPLFLLAAAAPLPRRSRLSLRPVSRPLAPRTPCMPPAEPTPSPPQNPPLTPKPQKPLPKKRAG